MSKLFSVPLFFIVFRETLEAAIIISVLLSLVENLFDKTDSVQSTLVEGDEEANEETHAQRKARLVKRMKVQIWAGAGTGLLIALCIGAAFITVFFTTLSDIWSKSEEIWEGSFSIVACIIIFIMGLTMLRIDRSKIKWRKKLEHAFDRQPIVKLSDEEAQKLKWHQKIVRKFTRQPRAPKAVDEHVDLQGQGGKWTLFLIPLITVLREGLEMVVFVGGVSLGQSATSIPLAAIAGIACGLIVGYLIYASSSRINLSIFLVISTNILLLLGAGLLSKAVGAFQRYYFNHGVGADVTELGDGPGSYNVQGNVWHLTYGSPENQITGQGWSVFNAVLGWTNNATYGTIVSYCLYWLAVCVALFYMKWSEGRVTFFGRHSPAGLRRQERQSQTNSFDGKSDVDEKSGMDAKSEMDGNSALDVVTI